MSPLHGWNIADTALNSIQSINYFKWKCFAIKLIFRWLVCSLSSGRHSQHQCSLGVRLFLCRGHGHIQQQVKGLHVWCTCCVNDNSNSDFTYLQRRVEEGSSTSVEASKSWFKYTKAVFYCVSCFDVRSMYCIFLLGWWQVLHVIAMVATDNHKEPTISYSTGLKHVLQCIVLKDERIMCAAWPLCHNINES